jgi:hypothetical protein
VFECAVKFNGANTVKYGFARADTASANGFAGVEGCCIDGANFVEKGNRVDNKDDIEGSAVGRFAFLVAGPWATNIELVPKSVSWLMRSVYQTNLHEFVQVVLRFHGLILLAQSL